MSVPEDYPIIVTEIDGQVLASCPSLPEVASVVGPTRAKAMTDLYEEIRGYLSNNVNAPSAPDTTLGGVIDDILGRKLDLDDRFADAVNQLIASECANRVDLVAAALSLYTLYKVIETRMDEVSLTFFKNIQPSLDRRVTQEAKQQVLMSLFTQPGPPQ